MLRRLLSLLMLTGCADAPPPRPFDGAAALRAVEAQVAFGPRIPGTEGHRRQAAWMDSVLRGLADTVIAQRWTHVTKAGDSLPLTNLLARFNPAATERLLFLAHWDTRPRADGPMSKDSTAPVPGANDGGSGVAVLLGVADALKRLPPAANVGVDLLFVDGEDYGSFSETPNDVLIGSRHYARNLPPGPPLYAVLFDLVGDRDLRIYHEGNSLTGAADVVNLVWERAREIGHGDVFIDQPKHTLTDDHLELQKVGIRAIDVIDYDYGPETGQSGGSYWHTTEDTADKVSAESLRVVGEVALALVALAERK